MKSGYQRQWSKVEIAAIIAQKPIPPAENRFARAAEPHRHMPYQSN